MAIAPTGEGLAFSDGDGYVHLWSAEEDAKFARFDGEVELPDEIVPPERIDWKNDTCVPSFLSSFIELTRKGRPLNSIGVPFYTTPLLSLYPSTVAYDHVPSPSHHIPTPIDPLI